ncbi:MAG: CoA transferase [Ruminococcaceae bacterium]|jgi:crotonobetainyl-CoA:carnitine CoA-transferase CaiB-like acyl-CoA transferase|nr:CoA transferase [Oscillospiraceae bacterium]
MKALEGIKVIDLSRYISGPYCAQLLGDMGAEVIKVESPGGEIVRQYEPAIDGNGFYFMVFNRNKKGITVNSRTEKGKEILRKLFQEADVVIQNFKPGTMEAMGFGWETLHKLNPRLILASISGFGSTGPMAEYPGFDSVLQAMGGLMSMTGSPDSEPYLAGTYVIDYNTASNTAFGILSALYSRERTGEGQHVQTSLLNTAASLLIEAIPQDMLLHQQRNRIGNKDKNTAPVGCFKAKDDYVYIIAAPQAHWEKLAAVIGRPELITDPKFLTVASRYQNADELNEYVAQWAAALNRDEIVEILNQQGIPAAPVLSISEFIRLPQVKHNQQIIEVPYQGVGNIPMQGFPVQLSKTPPQITMGPPNLGEHSVEILKSLGYTEEQISEMSEKGDI